MDGRGRKRMFDRIKNKVILFRWISLAIIFFALILITIRSTEFIKKNNTFSIHNIVLKENELIQLDDVITILDLKNSRKNIFQIRLQEAKNKLLAHPRIKSVVLQRQLPHTLIIEIKERKSLVLMNSKTDFGNSLYELDETGCVLGQDPYIDNYDLPIITYHQKNDIIVGEKITNKFLIKILDTLYHMNQKIYNFNRLIAEIHVTQGEQETNVIMYLNNFNIKVLLGNEFTENKLKKINSLLIVLGSKIKDLEYIDFKYNEAVSKYKI